MAQHKMYFAHAMLTVAIVFSTASAETLEDVVIENYDDGHVGWDAGRMIINLPSKTPDRVIVEFIGQKRERLDLLNLKTNAWSVDLSKFVRGLEHPFPSRLAIVFRKSASGNILIILNLPFEPLHSSKDDDSHCNALEIVIEKGIVLSDKTMTTPSDRCAF